MNIFILSRTTAPAVHYRTQAVYHCDKHVVKMIAESTQMLATAVQKFSAFFDDHDGNSLPLPCKPLTGGFTKHPCTAWTCASIVNTNYLCRLALALCDEHQHRYPLSADHQYWPFLRQLGKELDMLGFHINHPLPTHFAVAVKDPALRSTATPHQEAVDIYRRYYQDDKAPFATWKHRNVPEWFVA